MRRRRRYKHALLVLWPSRVSAVTRIVTVVVGHLVSCTIHQERYALPDRMSPRPSQPVILVRVEQRRQHKSRMFPYQKTASVQLMGGLDRRSCKGHNDPEQLPAWTPQREADCAVRQYPTVLRFGYSLCWRLPYLAYR